MSDQRETDLIDLVAGPLLGEGAHRKVFVFKPDRKKVIKLAQAETRSHNLIEFRIWNDVLNYDKALRKWFAPCYDISELGLWMTQARTTALSIRDLPKRIPQIMTDTKPANWGWYEGRPVCHDYSNCILRLNLVPKKHKKASWFGLDGY